MIIQTLTKNKRSPKSWFDVLFDGTGWALFTMLVWEMVEEALEYAIAYLVSSVVTLLIAKVLTTLTIITITQAIKVGIKRFITPIILKFTQKDGGDKLNMFKKFLQALNANKCTIVGIISAVAVALSGGGIIQPDTFLPEWNVNAEVVYYEEGEVITAEVLYEVGEVITEAVGTEGEEGYVPAVVATGTEVKVAAVVATGTEVKEVVDEGTNLTPILYYCLLGVFIILASFFPEKVSTYAKRIAETVAAKQEAADVKAAEALVKAEKKQADKDMKEAAKVKAAEEKAAAQAIVEAEKQKAKEEHDKKIAELVAQMKANEQNKKA